MTLAPSNLTNAVASLATRLDFLINGVNEAVTEMETHLPSVLKGEDQTQKEHASGLLREAMKKARYLVEAIKAEADQVNNVAKQIPQEHSQGPNVGAIGTTDGGTGVSGPVGRPEDQIAVEKSDSGAPTNQIEGTGIVGMSPETAVANDPETKAAEVSQQQ